jgi:nitrite reductase (cytochrome c-552)
MRFGKFSRHKHLNDAIVAGILAAILCVLGLMLLLNIFEKKQEARHHFLPSVQLTESDEDAAKWGQNFPLQYESYLKTVDQVRTKYGGSEAIPRTPTASDPRSIVSQSRIEEDPRLKQIWAGYAFSKDFREERGHAFMLVDQLFTERQQFVPQPGACIQCHSSAVTAMRKLGNGDMKAGFDALNAMPYAEAKSHVNHPVSCIDCHTPETMKLRITRPAFMEGIKALKASQGVANFDVNRDASHQEMRAYVCGQCHVEYYFKAPNKTLTFPWSEGVKADQILAYYEKNPHKDWIHTDAKTPALKAQHPEFELWSQGTHGKSGVSCADCHMPYKRSGSIKFTDHHIQSPLLNIGAACQTCHRQSEAFLLSRVTDIQEKSFSLRNVAMDAVVALIADLKAAIAENKAADVVETAQKHHRRAQFFLDFIEAENSTGFHAPQEAARVLALSIEESRKGQLALRQK